MTPEPIDIVSRLRTYAEDLHSARGFNGYAAAMSLAADEIVRLRDYAALVAEKEREACAEVCGEIESDMWAQYMGRGKYAGVPSSKIGSADIAGNSDGACKCAEAIRARNV